LQHRVLLLRHPILPDSIIILIDLCNPAILIDLNHHAHMAHEVFPIRFNGDFAIWSDNVVGAAAVPDLLENGAGGRRMDGLLTVSAEQ
jgi:hypothetical protein